MLLITLDTTRADSIGCSGGEEGVTPVLDRLAGRGVMFEAAQAVAPVTLPSHASMLTGLYPYRHGVRNNGMFALPSSVETLATVFRRAGASTAAFVSASVLARRYGLDIGFDVFDDDLSQGAQATTRGIPTRRGDLTLERALTWIDQVPATRPFFCWIHLYDPHAPYDPPPDLKRRFLGDPYTGEIAFVDRLVGEALAHLEERGLTGSTVVSVVADHGEALGEHGERTHGILLHQATIHVPWILAGPGVPRGARYSEPTSGVDVAPTLAALAGVTAPNRGTCDGLDVLAGWRPGARPAAAERDLLSESMLPTFQYGWAPLLGARRGRWQLTQGLFGQLFDLGRDPRELTDLAGREELVVEQLAHVLAPLEPPPDTENARLDLSRSEVEALAALGYLGGDSGGRRDPPDPRAMIHAHVSLEAARNLVDRGDPKMALEALTECLRRDPFNIAALLMRSDLLASQGETEAARRDLEACMELDPDGASAFGAMAYLELRDGRPERALELATAGAGKRGAFESMTVIRGSALVALDRAGEAERLVDTRLEADPDDPDLLSFRGELFARRGEVARAEELFRRAVTVDALHLPARFNLARLLRGQDRAAEAIEVLEGLLSIQPGNPAALALIGDIRLTEPEAAVAYLEEAVRLAPASFDALVNLGRCHIQLGNGRKAESVLRRALEVHPDSSSAANNLAVALILQGQLRAAESLLRALLDDEPRFAQARNNLALVIGRQGRLDEAESEARLALASDPNLLDARLTLASIFNELGRAAEATAILEPLASSPPDHLDFAIQYGLALAGSGRAVDSIPWLERAAASSNGGDATVLVALASAREAIGELAEARRLYERAAQVSQDDGHRARALEGIERLSLTGSAAAADRAGDPAVALP